MPPEVRGPASPRGRLELKRTDVRDRRDEMRHEGAVALAVATALTLAGCGRGHDPKTISAGGRRIAVADLRDVVPGLCATERAARPRLARTAFYDRSHAQLHQIVVAVEPVDRSLAARLLEAMQRVEADLAMGEPPPARARHLAALVQLTRRAFARLSIATTGCGRS